LYAVIYLSREILVLMNLIEEHRRNGKQQPKLVSRDRLKTADRVEKVGRSFLRQKKYASEIEILNVRRALSG